MGNSGQVIMFVMLIVAQVIAWGVVGAYVAHCFLTVVEDTTAGIDEITWTREPSVDWIWKPLYLVWLAAFWLVPIGTFLRVADPPLLAEQRMLRFLVVAAVGLWLLFPISLLSSLSATSRWTLFRGAIVRGLARRVGTLAAFYGASGLVLAACAACFYPALTGGSGLFVPVAAAVGAAGILIYARLLGRLGWALRHVQLPVADRPRPKDRRRRINPYPEATNPWAVPAAELNKRMQEEGPVVTHPLDGPVESYTVADDAPTSAAEQTRRKSKEEEPPWPVPFDGPAIPYELTSGAAPALPQEIPLDGFPAISDDDPFPDAGDAGPGKHSRQKPTSRERARRGRGAPPPPFLLVNGVYTFPWYWATLPVWGLMLIGLLVLEGLFRLQMQFWPGG